VLATSDESQRVVNRYRRGNAALASIASHMCVSRAARRFWAKRLGHGKVGATAGPTLGGVP
jgi:transposase-like protein